MSGLDWGLIIYIAIFSFFIGRVSIEKSAYRKGVIDGKSTLLEILNHDKNFTLLQMIKTQVRTNLFTESRDN